MYLPPMSSRCATSNAISEVLRRASGLVQLGHPKDHQSGTHSQSSSRHNIESLDTSTIVFVLMLMSSVSGGCLVICIQKGKTITFTVVSGSCTSTVKTCKQKHTPQGSVEDKLPWSNPLH